MSNTLGKSISNLKEVGSVKNNQKESILLQDITTCAEFKFLNWKKKKEMKKMVMNCLAKIQFCWVRTTNWDTKIMFKSVKSHECDPLKLKKKYFCLKLKSFTKHF